MAKAAGTAGEDCAAMAEGLKVADAMDGYVGRGLRGDGRGAEDLGRGGQARDEGVRGFPGETVEEHMTALNARFGERIDAALILIGETTEVCEDDPAVLEQLQQMGFSG